MSLFIELRKHGKLAAKRNPMYEKNKFGKFWMYFMAVFWAGYLIFFGTTFAFAFGDGATEAYHEQRTDIRIVPGLSHALSISENTRSGSKALSAITGKAQPSYRFPADTLRIERLQPDMAVFLCSVRYHQHY